MYLYFKPFWEVDDVILLLIQYTDYNLIFPKYLQYRANFHITIIYSRHSPKLSKEFKYILIPPHVSPSK